MPKNIADNFQRLPNTDAIATFEGKTLMTTWHYLDMLAQEHATAFTVAKIMDEDLLKEVQKAMQDAIANGTSFNDFQKRLKPYLMAKGWWGENVKMKDPKTGEIKEVHLGSTRRLKIIYNTNKRTARASARWQRIQKTKNTFPYLQYRKSTSENKRLNHKQYYGLVLPVNSPVWKLIFPPNGYGCKCRTKQLTAKEAENLKEKLQSSEDEKERAKAEKIYLNGDDFELEFEDFKNPRTGKIIQVPKGIEPSFAHNHDRLSAIMELAKEKHGERFVQLTKKQIDEYILDMLVPKHIPIVDFKNITPRQAEIDRLARDGKDQVRLSEGAIADQYQQYYNVVLERFDSNKHKFLVAEHKPDFAIRDDIKVSQEWLTLDFIFTLEEGANVAEFNRSFNKSDIAWEKRQNRIRQHLAKADITPLLLKHFDSQTCIKILLFVLQLPEHLQKRIVLITNL